MLNSSYGDNISFFTYHIDLKQGAFVSANIPYYLFQVDNSLYDVTKKLGLIVEDKDWDKLQKSIIKEQAKDTPSKTNDETEVIGGRKKKKLRQHKKTIKEQQEKATNKVEEYLAKIESYISLIEIESGKKKIEEYESKIEAYESLIELEEDNDDEYSETITDDDTGEVTEIIRKKKKKK